MMTIIGMFSRKGLTNPAWGDGALCTAALRAFEPKLGVQAPANFWDPLGYTEVDNVATLKRRRETELKP
jgi:hypothetical protein